MRLSRVQGFQFNERVAAIGALLLIALVFSGIFLLGWAATRLPRRRALARVVLQVAQRGGIGCDSVSEIENTF